MATAPSTKISVVIPTFNRRVLLRELLASLLRQSFPSAAIEIIVIDDGSTDGTRAMVEEMAGSAPCAMRIHLQDHQGQAAARNHGVARATGEIIAFIDSDCTAHPDWLQNAVRRLGPDTAFVSGSVHDKPGQPVTFFSLRHGAPGYEFPTYPTCNVLYRKDKFLAYGGFDPAKVLPVGPGGAKKGCEDADLAWKMKRAGEEHRFAGDAIVYHEVVTFSPLGWVLEGRRLWILAFDLKHVPEVGRMGFLHWGVFTTRHGPFRLLFAAGVLAGAALHPLWFALAAPYLLLALRALKDDFVRPGRVHRGLVKLVLGAGRYLVELGAMLYGSVRFRCLVLP